MGIEPTLEAWEASVLPLNYARSADAHCSPSPPIQFNMSITVNGETRLFSAPLALPALLTELQLGERRVAVEINGEIVPRSQHAQTTVQDGDEILIVHAIGGG